MRPGGSVYRKYRVEKGNIVSSAAPANVGTGEVTASGTRSPCPRRSFTIATALPLLPAIAAKQCGITPSGGTAIDSTVGAANAPGLWSTVTPPRYGLTNWDNGTCTVENNNVECHEGTEHYHSGGSSDSGTARNNNLGSCKTQTEKETDYRHFQERQRQCSNTVNVMQQNWAQTFVRRLTDTVFPAPNTLSKTTRPTR